MAMLLLIRHGQASFGSANYDRLSPLGEQQARVLGRYLRASGTRLSAAISGSLQRQQRTAQLVLEALEAPPVLAIDARFNELDVDAQIDALGPGLQRAQPSLAAHSALAQTSSKDYQKLLRVVFQHWAQLVAPPPPLRSYPEYAQDYWEALSDAMAAGERGASVAVFTSGGTIALLVTRVLGLSAEHAYTFYEPLRNASLTRLLFQPGRVSLSNFNETAYLDGEGQPGDERLLSYR